MAQARHRGREGGGEGGGGGPGGGGGGRRPRRDRESDGFESVIQIKRCAAVVKGGRRFSFNAVVVVGDKRGNVGLGYGKAKEVPPAVDKAVKAGNRSLVKVKMNARHDHASDHRPLRRLARHHASRVGRHRRHRRPRRP